MRFAKLHGLGNDFLLLDLRDGGEPLPAARAIALCDRNFGVGGDGVLTLLPSPGYDARMLIQNSDGSVPEMCGNGARCAALFIATDGGRTPARREVALLTEAGPRPCAVEAFEPRRGVVEVEMGVAEVAAVRELPVGDRRLEAVPVGVGNPHRVIFVDAGRGGVRELAEKIGPGLCRTENANIEFAARLAPQQYAVSVWERGAGLTAACGTGACATAAAAVARGEARRNQDISIELPGGTLTVRVDARNGVRMRGPAELVFFGEL